MKQNSAMYGHEIGEYEMICRKVMSGSIGVGTNSIGHHILLQTESDEVWEDFQQVRIVMKLSEAKRLVKELLSQITKVEDLKYQIQKLKEKK